MPPPGVTRNTRHYMAGADWCIVLSEYIGAHETTMSTSPTEITVEQSQDIESYAEAIQSTHAARPLYAGLDPDTMLEHIDDVPDPYLAVVYNEGNFYLGRAAIVSRGRFPTTGMVTQNTDFPQSEPWIASWNGATRIVTEKAAPSEELARHVVAGDKVFLLIGPSALEADAEKTVGLVTGAGNDKASDTVKIKEGIFELGNVTAAAALKLKVSADLTGATEFVVMIGPEIAGAA